jgi:hypothetical protein
MEQRLMTLAEIPRALNILGVKVPAGTVRRWASEIKKDTGKVRLEPAIQIDDDTHLYRLHDAMKLADRRKTVAA